MSNQSKLSERAVTVVVVTWNSKHFLFGLFRSLDKQTYSNFELIIVDNASTDGTAEFIKQQYPQAKLIINSSNLGFVAANNQAMRMSKTAYVLLCNPDIVLDSNFISEALKTAGIDEQVGSVGGKLLKAETALNTPTDSDTIDSTGIVIFKNRRAVDRGESEKDTGQYEKREEVFGISGALVLYRKLALEKMAVNGEYFDEDFFAYKEDVDLAWRLRLGGYKSIYNPLAKAYHRRSVARKTDLTDTGTIENRQQKSVTANYLSYRNHLFMIIKNDGCQKILLNPALIWYEMKKFIYILLREPVTLKALSEVFKKSGVMRDKHKKIIEITVVRGKELTKWFN